MVQPRTTQDTNTMREIHCTAASLNAMIQYTSAGSIPPIAFDRDDLAEPLAQKLREAVKGKERSDNVALSFSDDEKDLQRQFEGCAYHIADIWAKLRGDFKG